MRSCHAEGAKAKPARPSLSVKDGAGTKSVLAKRVVYAYTGRERGVTFQQSAPAHAVPKQLVWKKGERLGITFVERRSGGGVVVAKTAQRALGSLADHQLAFVQGVPVGSLDISSVLRVLEAAPSPCVLEFAVPPAPVTVAHVSTEMKRSGVQPGMALAAINGERLAGATLSEVLARVSKATESRPLMLELVASESQRVSAKSAAPALQSPGRQQAQVLRKTHARNGMSVAAVLAALSF